RPVSAYFNSAIVPQASPLYVRHIPVDEPFTTPQSSLWLLRFVSAVDSYSNRCIFTALVSNASC
ncbi:hypothetical protein ACIRYU_005056, partial [Escherichia coli]